MDGFKPFLHINGRFSLTRSQEVHHALQVRTVVILLNTEIEMDQMTALQGSICWCSVTHRGIRPSINNRAAIIIPCSLHFQVSQLTMHEISQVIFSLTRTNVLECPLVYLFRGFHRCADALHLARSFSAAQRSKDIFGRNELTGMRGAFQIAGQQLVHSVSQAISGWIVEGGVDCDLPRIKFIQDTQQVCPNGCIIANHFIKYPSSPGSFHFMTSQDSNPFSRFCHQEGRCPG